MLFGSHAMLGVRWPFYSKLFIMNYEWRISAALRGKWWTVIFCICKTKVSFFIVKFGCYFSIFSVAFCKLIAFSVFLFGFRSRFGFRINEQNELNAWNRLINSSVFLPLWYKDFVAFLNLNATTTIEHIEEPKLIVIHWKMFNSATLSICKIKQTNK